MRLDERRPGNLGIRSIAVAAVAAVTAPPSHISDGLSGEENEGENKARSKSRKVGYARIQVEDVAAGKLLLFGQAYEFVWPAHDRLDWVGKEGEAESTAGDSGREPAGGSVAGGGFRGVWEV